MDGNEQWWFCLKHKTVEFGPGCPGKDRLGPYASRAEASHALETVKRRNQEWDAADEWPGPAGP